MSRFFTSIIFLLLFNEGLFAQDRQDTIHTITDTIRHVLDTNTFKQPEKNIFSADSISKRPEQRGSWHISIGSHFFTKEFNKEILERHPYFGFNTPGITVITNQKKFNGKDFLFYMLIAFLLAFALLKKLFPKYFSDLFRLFFRTTLKQRQIKEQLMQSPLPSLLFNGFFVFSSALYIDFLLQYFNLNNIDDFWKMFLYCGLAVSIVYLIKFIGLKLTGWIFGATEAADSYLFIVFVVNKILGIYLLPFLVLLAFTQGSLYQVSMTLSWCGIGALYLYRLILSYSALRNQVKLNLFHFFLYLCAFEVAPLFLIYKALLFFFNRTT
ncbi:MAG: DUF4271 domain-containing protein [Bacteroidetes bacterium]|nr:DUF4271 domain-containing protein [Bacteroidota bacterium]MBS1930827.1 DUF4271 domain-containing protein [Bacteroidota bacterium]